MPYAPTTGDRLLAAWLSLTSTLWNKRLVSTLTYNEAHVLGILLVVRMELRDSECALQLVDKHIAGEVVIDGFKSSHPVRVDSLGVYG